MQIDDLQPETYLQAYRYLNLALGLLTLLPIYGTAALLCGRRGGAVAALLFAGAWVSYRAAPLLVPQTLAGLLAALAFYLIIWQGQQKESPDRKWGWFWVGTACGAATAAAYGSVLLLIPGLIQFQVQSSKFKVREVEAKGQEAILSGKRPASLIYPLLGWLVGFSGLVSGWLLSLPNFLNGLASIGPAPAGALKFYFKELAGHDPGLLLGLSGGLLLGVISSFRFYLQGNPSGRVSSSILRANPSGRVSSSILRAEFQVSYPEGELVSSSQTANGELSAIRFWQRVSLLSFPTLYLLALLIFGPLDGARLALCAPFLALGTAYPIEVAARFMAGRLNDGRHRWAGTATAFGLTILVLLLGAVARRFVS